jgi:hypothetical protein
MFSAAAAARSLGDSSFVTEEQLKGTRTRIRTMTAGGTDGIPRARMYTRNPPIGAEIFGDFELILSVNVKFLMELEDCAREWHNKPHAGPILHAWVPNLPTPPLVFRLNFFLFLFGWGGGWSQMPVMKLYVGYVRHYEQMEAALHRCEKRTTRFAALLKECKAMPANRRKLPLSAYLIMPIQRVARHPLPSFLLCSFSILLMCWGGGGRNRYRLLALEILRHTPEEHLDRGQMELAVERLEELCATINDSKRDSDSRKVSLQLIATRISGAPVRARACVCVCARVLC